MSGYIPFDFSDFDNPPATVATVATVEPARSLNPHITVATVATVAGALADSRRLMLNTVASVATVATVAGPIPDPEALFLLLCEVGPMTYGVAASTLGWGATRTWQADDTLRRSGRVKPDHLGRMVIIKEIDA